ncbi:MAG: HIT family hydrolase [Deltaproteobacteria bacterium]|nr:MAG: HIT family hydrolase [Deltaproteobacteria bacterium]
METRKFLWAPWRMTYINAEKEDGCVFCNRLGSSPEKDRENLILLRRPLGFIMMNKFPYNSGHLLIIPNRHVPDLRDLDDDELLGLQRLLALSLDVLEDLYHPDGFNIGMNLGRSAGAGIEEHLHYHLVPRWNGDTNFMSVLADVRVVPQHLQTTYDQLKEAFSAKGIT